MTADRKIVRTEDGAQVWQDNRMVAHVYDGCYLYATRNAAVNGATFEFVALISRESEILPELDAWLSAAPATKN